MKSFNYKVYLKLMEGRTESFERMMESLDENNQPDIRRVFEYLVSRNALFDYVQRFKHPKNSCYRTTQYTDTDLL